MKNKFTILIGIAMLFVFSGQPAFSADVTNELKTLVAQVRTDIQAGKRTEADLAGDLKQFDALLAEHKGEKTDAVAEILFMKAMLYLQVLGNVKTGTNLLNQVKTDFPGTQPAVEVDKIVAMIQQQAEARKISDVLAVGAKFPDFNVTDLDGKPLSVASHKGKVVLIDFWATWCPPCRAEIPNVVAVYDKYHGKGFDIIGVSLDEEKAKLSSYTKEQNMTWPQYFDGRGWSNKLAVTYGIESIPLDFLLDGNDVIIGKDLRGDDLEAAVAKAVTGK
jgi:thiol-disulfide isomerase/thioredoxin